MSPDGACGQCFQGHKAVNGQQLLLDQLATRQQNAHALYVGCSFAKTVRGHTHRQTGVKELMAMLLNSLDPLDALTFARMPGIFTPSRKRKRTEDVIENGLEVEIDTPSKSTKR